MNSCPEPNPCALKYYSRTTWVSQIVHGLRSNGSLEFGEIGEVVPWCVATRPSTTWILMQRLLLGLVKRWDQFYRSAVSWGPPPM